MTFDRKGHRMPPAPPNADGIEPEKDSFVRPFDEASQTVWLTPENASFSEENGFLYLHKGETVARVNVLRQFPFETPWEFLSVVGEDGDEIGIIRALDLFGEADAPLIRRELERRYYAPVVKQILYKKDRYGFSHWRVLTKDGEVSFTLHDTFKNIIHAGENRILFLDVDGNRFVIPDVTALDKKSYKKIELYL